MNGTRDKSDSAGPTRVRRSVSADLALALVVVFGLGCAALLTYATAPVRAAEGGAQTVDESLYFEPRTLKRMSLAFNGLAADWYWMRTLQYVGRKVIAHDKPLPLDDLSALNLDKLELLLDAITTLDPQFYSAYEYGAVILPAVDAPAAVRLLEKGVRENPTDWRLHHHLGYVHWQAGRYAQAAAAYREGARVPGAPAWIEAMSAQMEAQGGSRATARQIYLRMFEGSGDEQVRGMASVRLQQLDSLDERDAIRVLFAAYKARISRCPTSWREVAPALRSIGLRTDAAGAPLDPTGVPYELDSAACDVKLGDRSKIPRH